jgi:hypothetical protein
VRWAWLAFLAAQIGLSFVFLLAVMLYTAALGVDVVKSTSVAELFAMRPRGFSEPRGIRPSIDGQLVGRLRKEGHLWNLEVHRKDSEWPLQGG